MIFHLTPLYISTVIHMKYKVLLEYASLMKANKCVGQGYATITHCRPNHDTGERGLAAS